MPGTLACLSCHLIRFAESIAFVSSMFWPFFFLLMGSTLWSRSRQRIFVHMDLNRCSRISQQEHLAAVSDPVPEDLIVPVLRTTDPVIWMWSATKSSSSHNNSGLPKVQLLYVQVDDDTSSLESALIFNSRQLLSWTYRGVGAPGIWSCCLLLVT